MITVLAKINISSAGADAISEATINQKGLDFANKISNIVNNSVSGKNPFILGTSALGSGAVFTKYGVDLGYYIGQPCGENGEFSADNVLTFKVENGVEAITVEFAKETNEYAVSIFLFDMSDPQTPLKSWVNDDPIFTAKYSFEAGKQYGFLFETWSKPNSRLVLQGFYSKSEFVFDRRSIISTDTKIADRNSFDEPSFGIFSNSGTLELRDLDGEIYDAVREGIIAGGTKVSIWIKNTITKREVRVADMFTDTFNYDADNRTLSVTLKNNLGDMQSQTGEAIYIDPTISQFSTLYDVYNTIREKTREKLPFLNFKVLDEETTSHLQSIRINFHLEEASIWAQWEKLCVVAQCHLYQDDDGDCVFKYNGGN
jgi:hypothetical protein